MKRERYNNALVFSASAIISVIALIFFEGLAAIMKTGLKAAFVSAGGLMERFVQKNYFYDNLATWDWWHILSQSVFVVGIVAILLRKWKCFAKKPSSFWWTMVIFGMAAVGLELISYLGYIIQFLIDALVTGIMNKVPSVTLANKVHPLYWLEEIDLVWRLCEAYAVTKVIFYLKSFTLWYGRKTEPEDFTSRNRQRRRPVKQESQHKHSFSAEGQPVKKVAYNMTAECRNDMAKLQEEQKKMQKALPLAE